MKATSTSRTSDICAIKRKATKKVADSAHEAAAWRARPCARAAWFSVVAAR